MKIVVHHEYPPIPCRKFDWCAYDADSYEPGRPLGWGATKLEAIEDLLLEMEEAE